MVAAMMRRDPDADLVNTLPVRLRLPLIIGQIVQLDVDVHYELRQLWLHFVGASPARIMVPDSFGPLVEQCRYMLDEAVSSAVLRAAAQALFADTKSAHEARNRYVHDTVLPFTDELAIEDGRLTIGRYRRRHEDPEVTEATVDDAKRVRLDLSHVRMRLQHLRVRVLWPNYDYGDENDDWMAIIGGDYDRGRFVGLPPSVDEEER